jgi:hypothetical protein
MTSEQLISRLGSKQHAFAETLEFIAEHYHYQPSAFTNGTVSNTAEQNQGSCKVLAMAQDQRLTDEQTLLCFAEHYQAVLADPAGSDHANIRALMQHGLAAVQFAHPPLTRR